MIDEWRTQTFSCGRQFWRLTHITRGDIFSGSID